MKIRKVYASEAAIRSCSMKKAFLKKKSKNLQENTCAGVSALRNTAQKRRFSFTDYFSKCDQIRSFLRIWSHLLKKSVTENLIFCVMNVARLRLVTLS